jgi:type IV pilus assembly protein PilY1
MNNMLRVLALGVAILLPARADPPVLVIDSWPLRPPASRQCPGRRLRMARAAAFHTVLGERGRLYQATMNIADWGGHFSRYVLSAGVGTTSTLAWDAGAILTGAPGRAPEPRRSVARSTLHWCSRMARWPWCPSHGPRCRRAASIAQP